jgi:hypothetical protein
MEMAWRLNVCVEETGAWHRGFGTTGLDVTVLHDLGFREIYPATTTWTSTEYYGMHNPTFRAHQTGGKGCAENQCAIALYNDRFQIVV